MSQKWEQNDCPQKSHNWDFKGQSFKSQKWDENDCPQ